MNRRQIKKYKKKINEELLVCRKSGYGMAIKYQGCTKYDENGIPQHIEMRKVPLVKRYKGKDLGTTTLGTTGNGRRMSNLMRMADDIVSNQLN